MEHIKKCDVCGSDRLKNIFKDKEGLGLSVCSECGLYFTNPRPELEEVENFYDECYFKHWFEYKDVKIKTNLRRLDFIKKAKPEFNTLFDYGCGLGLFLKTVTDNSNAECAGVEFSGFAVKYAVEKLNLNVENISDYDFDKNKLRFDIVTIWHTLEHLKNPADILKKLYGLLADNGVLVIEVPNRLGLLQLLRGKRSYPLREHFYHFEPDTLNKMVVNTGFKLVSSQPGDPGYTRTGLKITVKKFLAKTGNIIYKTTGLNFGDTILSVFNRGVD